MCFILCRSCWSANAAGTYRVRCPQVCRWLSAVSGGACHFIFPLIVFRRHCYQILYLALSLRALCFNAPPSVHPHMHLLIWPWAWSKCWVLTGLAGNVSVLKCSNMHREHYSADWSGWHVLLDVKKLVDFVDLCSSSSKKKNSVAEWDC